MELLRTASHVENFVWMPVFNPIRESGEIGSGIVESAITLLDDGRIRLPLAVLLFQERIAFWRERAVRKNADGPRAFLCEGFLAQFLDDRRELRVVEAFAQAVIKLHPEARINRIKLSLRKRLHLPPDA